MESWELDPYKLKPWELSASVEAILMASDRLVKLSAIATGLGISETEAEDAVRDFEAELMGQGRGVRVRHRNGAVRLEVKPQLVDIVCEVLPQWTPKVLSKQATETLALIAYSQPITSNELEERRGKDCTATVQQLRNRRLVARTAQLGPRRQKLWRTTRLFLKAYGLDNLDQLYQEGAKERYFPMLFTGDAEEDTEDGEEARLENPGIAAAHTEAETKEVDDEPEEAEAEE